MGEHQLVIKIVDKNTDWYEFDNIDALGLTYQQLYEHYTVYPRLIKNTVFYIMFHVVLNQACQTRGSFFCGTWLPILMDKKKI